MPAQQTAAQGQPVLDNSRPRLADDANDHAPTGPSRNTAALAATPIASTASPTTDPAGPIGPSNGSRSWANTVNQTRTIPALTANRRSQPRTVDTGNPNISATRRCPEPDAFATSAAPITSTPSRRRSRLSALINTCVTAHDVHRERRARCRNTTSPQRKTRHRAHPHGHKRPAQSGHPSSPANKARSTSSRSVPTIFNSAPGHQEEPSRHRQK